MELSRSLGEDAREPTVNKKFTFMLGKRKRKKYTDN